LIIAQLLTKRCTTCINKKDKTQKWCTALKHSQIFFKNTHVNWVSSGKVSQHHTKVLESDPAKQPMILPGGGGAKPSNKYEEGE
jgi:hypothetical protein